MMVPLLQEYGGFPLSVLDFRLSKPGDDGEDEPRHPDREDSEVGPVACTPVGDEPVAECEQKSDGYERENVSTGWTEDVAEHDFGVLVHSTKRLLRRTQPLNFIWGKWIKTVAGNLHVQRG